MEWTVWNTLLLYLSVGAIIGLAMHQIMLAAMNRQAGGDPHPCEVRRTLGTMLHDVFEGIPDQMRPWAAVMLWMVWTLVWPPITFFLAGLWLHHCEDECAPDNLREDPHQ